MRRVWVERRNDGAAAIVYWAIEEIPSGFVGFNVRRSPQPCSELSSPSLELLTESPIVVPFYVDEDAPTLGIPAYLVTQVDAGGEHAIDRSMQVGDTSDPDHQGRRKTIVSPPRVFAEMRRRKKLLLDRNGEIVTVLIRRMGGRRCPACFDGTYEGSGKADCSTCYSTGWDRGFEVVDGVLMRITSIEEALKLQPPALVFSSAPKAWLVGFPLLRNGDVIVRPTAGKRYEVQKIDPAVHQGILTHQDCELVAFDPGHPIYGFPISP